MIVLTILLGAMLGSVITRCVMLLIEYKKGSK